MTPHQKEMVRTTWAKVVPIQETAAELFYNRLFEEYPEVKPLFKGDMKEQGKKLMAMLNQAVGSLDNFDVLIAPLKSAGKAHKGYGVTAADYDKVGETLLWTLEAGLGDDFNGEVKDAWATAYTTLSGVMIEGAQYDVAAVNKTKAPKKSWFKSLFSPT